MFREMRRFKQQLSEEECLEVLRTEKRGAFAVIGEEGYPYATPLNFYYNDEDGKLYFHGALQGHRLDSIRENNKVCFTTWDQGYIEEGDWAYYVKSVIVRGTAGDEILPHPESRGRDHGQRCQQGPDGGCHRRPHERQAGPRGVNPDTSSQESQKAARTRPVQAAYYHA